MYPHSAQLTRTITEDRLRNSERRRQILAIMSQDMDEPRNWIARLAGLRLATRRARTSPAQQHG